MKIRSLFHILFLIFHLMISFLGLWVTLGWKVRKARKAFEKELILQGMREKDAERLGAQYSKMKKEIVEAFKLAGNLGRARPT